VPHKVHASMESARSLNTEEYYLTDDYEPYPAILVRLSRIKRASLKELLTESWKFVQEQIR
jgi:hypothetical protein